jgi:hypothetical protein
LGGKIVATAADYLRAYQDQTGVDADAALESVVEFLSVYGMGATALEVLCDTIDQEGMTRDFASQLEADGLVTDVLDVEGDDVHSDEDDSE